LYKNIHNTSINSVKIYDIHKQEYDKKKCHKMDVRYLKARLTNVILALGKMYKDLHITNFHIWTIGKLHKMAAKIAEVY